MAVTIKEIAETVGVSRGTVDRVLHDRGGVRPELAQRIRAIAHEKGYSPNRAGRGLAARKQPLVVGCLLPGEGNPFFEDIIAGYEQAKHELQDFGVTVIVESIRGYDPDDHIRAMRRLLRWGSTALCVSTIDTAPIRDFLSSVVQSGVPVVTVNTDLSGTNRLFYSGSDYRTAGRTAAGMLTMMPYHEPLKILISIGSQHVKGHNDRVSGFTQTLRRKKVNFTVKKIFESQDDDERAYTETRHILNEHPEINVIYIAGAGVEGICRAVKEKGRKKDLIVISFDDVATTRELLCDGIIDFTICQEPRRQSYSAVQKLFEYFLSGKTEPPEDELTNTVIKIKENL